MVFAVPQHPLPPFDDIRVRRALNYAVDRGTSPRCIGAALASPTCQIVATHHDRATGRTAPTPSTPTATGSGAAPTSPGPGRWSTPRAPGAKASTLWTFADSSPRPTYVADVLDQLGYPRQRPRDRRRQTPISTRWTTTPDAQAGMFGWFGNPLAVDMLSTLTCGFDPNPAHFCDPTDRRPDPAARRHRARRPGGAPRPGRTDRPRDHRPGPVGAAVHPAVGRCDLGPGRQLPVRARAAAHRPTLGPVAVGGRNPPGDPVATHAPWWVWRSDPLGPVAFGARIR